MKDDLNHIIRQFFDFEGLPSFFSLNQGHINDTYRCEIAGTSYLLQRINRSIFHQVEPLMENMKTVAKYLQQHSDLPHLLNPMISSEGLPYWKDANGAYWRILPFIEQSYAPERVRNEQEAFEAAQMLARFLAALRDLNVNLIHEIIPQFHNGVSRFANFEDAIAKANPSRLKKSSEAVAYIRSYASLFKKIERLNLPKWIVHNDPKISNVLFDKQSKKAICMIDWDTIMPGSVLSDFGDMVRTACASLDEEDQRIDEVEIVETLFRACCKGFLAPIRAFLTEKEKKYLLEGPKWIILEQAMRFLTDYLNGDIYYKITYEKQNLMRAKNQIALFQSFMNQEASFQTIIQAEL